jgi:hypothetical protein
MFFFFGLCGRLSFVDSCRAAVVEYGRVWSWNRSLCVYANLWDGKGKGVWVFQKVSEIDSFQYLITSIDTPVHNQSLKLAWSGVVCGDGAMPHGGLGERHWDFLASSCHCVFVTDSGPKSRAHGRTQGYMIRVIGDHVTMTNWGITDDVVDWRGLRAEKALSPQTASPLSRYP